MQSMRIIERTRQQLPDTHRSSYGDAAEPPQAPAGLPLTDPLRPHNPAVLTLLHP